MLVSYGVRERYMEARRACSGQPPPDAAQFATAISNCTQPIVKTGRLRRLQFLDDTDVVGSPPRKVRRHEAHSARSW